MSLCLKQLNVIISSQLTRLPLATMYLDLFAIHVHCSCSYVVEAVTKLCKVMAYNAHFTCGMIKISSYKLDRYLLSLHESFSGGHRAYCWLAQWLLTDLYLTRHYRLDCRESKIQYLTRRMAVTPKYTPTAKVRWRELSLKNTGRQKHLHTFESSAEVTNWKVSHCTCQLGVLKTAHCYH